MSVNKRSEGPVAAEPIECHPLEITEEQIAAHQKYIESITKRD